MLYVNVYIVARVFGGSEEGGWYYPVGTPVASIPIASVRERGKNYYIDSGKCVIHTCPYCRGIGDVEAVDEELNETFMRACECGEVPEHPEKFAEMSESLRKMFEDDVDRYEELNVSLEDHFAQPYPEHRPIYE